MIELRFSRSAVGALAGPVFLVLKLTSLHIRKALTMKSRNKTEMRLFHATNRVHVDYICQNNFEWILYGGLENRYGKGLCWRRASQGRSSSHAFVEMFLALLCKPARLDVSGLCWAVAVGPWP